MLLLKKHIFIHLSIALSKKLSGQTSVAEENIVLLTSTFDDKSNWTLIIASSYPIDPEAAIPAGTSNVIVNAWVSVAETSNIMELSKSRKEGHRVKWNSMKHNIMM